MEDRLLEEGKEAFKATDLASAEWCMEKIAEIEAKEAEVNAAYAAMIEKYTAWRDKEAAALADKKSYFSGLLDAWARGELAGSKKKSISLPSGRLGYRKGGVAFAMNGEAVDAKCSAMLDWAEDNAPGVVKTKKSLDWVTLKRHLQAVEGGKVIFADTGEVVEGMTATEAAPTFYVKVGD